MRDRALAGVVPYLPEALQLEALQAARAIGDETDRAHAQTNLASRLPNTLQPGILAEALQATRDIYNEFQRASALSTLAPHLSEVLLDEALQVACTILDESERARPCPAWHPT